MLGITNPRKNHKVDLFKPYTDLLRACYDKNNVTHTGLGTQAGCYNITGDNLDKLYQIQSKLIDEGITDLYLVARPCEIGQLLFDIDFDTPVETRQYKFKKHIEPMLVYLQNTMIDTFEYSDDAYNVIVYEKEKPTPRENKNNKFKDGFHIVYPNLVINSKHRLWFQEKLREYIIDNKLFSDIKFDNDMKTVVDTSIVMSNGWCLHGNRKPNGYLYEITKVFNSDLELIKQPKSSYEILKLTCNRKKCKEIKSKINIEPIVKTQSKKEKCKKEKKTKTKKEGKDEDEDEDEDEEKDVIDVKKKSGNSIISIECMKSLLDCLSDNRCEEYSEWFKIGAIIYNSSMEYDVFDEYSKKSKTKYDKDVCVKKWNGYKKNNENLSTLNTLIIMCKEDNIKKYEEIQKKYPELQYERIINEADITPKLINQIFCVQNPDSFVYDKNNDKFYYKNSFGIYFEDLKLDYFKRKIDELSIILDNYLLKRLSGLNDKKTIKHIMNRKKQIYSNLGSPDFTNKVYYYAVSFYGRDEINWNKSVYSIAFNNGVFDLKTGKIRPANEDEYFNITTMYDYRENYNKDIYNELKAVVDSMFSNKLESFYVLMTTSTCLMGNNLLEKCFFWYGKGRNGKGVLSSLIKQALGKFFQVITPNYFCSTAKNSTGSADPEMYSTIHSRALFTSEPEKGCKFKIGILKSITGRDSIKCRKLYGDLIEFEPMFKLFIQTNDLPEIDSQEAMKERINVISFRYKFVQEEDIDPNNEIHKKIDTSLKDKIKEYEYILAFFHILYDHYKEFMKNGYKLPEIPESFKIETGKYMNDNNPIKTWLDECVEITSDTKDKEKTSLLYESFRRFHSQSGYDKLSLIKFKNLLHEKYPESVKYQAKLNNVSYYRCVKLIDKDNCFDDE